jgi:hypothetical protein
MEQRDSCCQFMHNVVLEVPWLAVLSDTSSYYMSYRSSRYFRCMAHISSSMCHVRGLDHLLLFVQIVYLGRHDNSAFGPATSRSKL